MLWNIENRIKISIKIILIKKGVNGIKILYDFYCLGEG